MPPPCECEGCRAADIPYTTTEDSLHHLARMGTEQLAEVTNILLAALGDFRDLPPASQLIVTAFVRSLHLASISSDRETGINLVTDILGRSLEELGVQVAASPRGWCHQRLRRIWRGSLRRDTAHGNAPDNPES